MTRLFRSKSCGVIRNTTSMFDSYPPLTPSRREDYKVQQQQQQQDDDDDDNGYAATCPFTTPFITSPERHGKRRHNNQSPILDILAAVLRKSLVTCSSVHGEEDVDMSSIDIGWPTDVRHVSHVTFDRFNGFLGLPVELQHETDLPHKVPSASASVFGVSANSMQCSYDQRGNSVPTILLMMQKCLYSEGGLQAEGIFRIAAENSQEEYVRDQLNKGVVPHGIDVHCLAGLIKAWFRELPAGVLDTLTPEKVMHCHTVEECTQLVKFLPPTEAALLDWAINLMADVVQHENHNKMDARNIAMVFAPNMTQMADPLNALIHAVQVMNFLKTLIVKTLKEREESARARLLQSRTESPMNMDDSHSSKASWVLSHGQTLGGRIGGEPAESNHLCGSATSEKLECGGMEELWRSESNNDAEVGHESTSGRTTPVMGKMANLENGLRGEQEDREVEGMFERPSLKEGMRKLCTHPVFQLSKPVKRSEGLGVVNSRGQGGEAWT